PYKSLLNRTWNPLPIPRSKVPGAWNYSLVQGCHGIRICSYPVPKGTTRGFPQSHSFGIPCHGKFCVYCNLSACLKILTEPFQQLGNHYQNLLHSCKHTSIVVCRRVAVFLESSCKTRNKRFSHNQKSGKRADLTGNAAIIRSLYPGVTAFRTSGIIDFIRIILRVCNPIPGRTVCLFINIECMSDIF